MILAGNKKIKLFAGTTKVKAAFVGTTKVYPNASLAVTPSLAFAAAGGSAALSIQVEDGQAWSLAGLPAGWAASATSGTGTASVTIAAANNTTTAAKNSTIIVTSEDLSAGCAVSQEAGRIVYETPIITAFGYPDIPASGGTVTPNVLSYQQAYTWNGVAGSGGVLTTGGTVYYSNGTGQVSAPSLGTTEKARTAVADMYARVDMNGVTGKTVGYSVYQAANSWWDGHIELSAPSAPISAAGGTIALSWQLYRHWSSGAQNPVGQYGGLFGTAEGFTVAGGHVSAENRTTVQGAARSVDVFVNYAGIISNTVTVTQEANTITYLDQYLSVSPASISIPANGGSSTVTVTPRQNINYTSGATGYVNTSREPGINMIGAGMSYVKLTPAGIYQEYQYQITVTANTSTSSRSGYIQFVLSDVPTKTVNISQAGKPLPTIIIRDAAGNAVSSVTVKSNRYTNLYISLSDASTSSWSVLVPTNTEGYLMSLRCGNTNLLAGGAFTFSGNQTLYIEAGRVPGSTSLQLEFSAPGGSANLMIDIQSDF